MPEMKEGESHSEWMSRCVPVRIKEGEKQDQAVAVCASMWRAKHGGKKPKAKLFDDVIKARSGRVTSALGEERERERGLFNDEDFAYQAEPVPDVSENGGFDGEQSDDERDDDTELEDYWDDIQDDMEKRARMFAEVMKQPTPQGGHVTTALGNERRRSDRKRRELLSTMSEEPKKDDKEHSIEGEIVDEEKRHFAKFTVTKADPDQHRIFGWASVVEKDGRVVIDKQGDIIPVDELENAVFSYMLDSREHGHMHEKRGTGRLIMSMLTTPDIMKAFGLTQENDIVGWIAGYQIDDPELWAAHKRGELPEFSIAGAAQPIEIDVEKLQRGRRHARTPF